ncbi:MAG: winged helix-turn-helix domain-containing protein [Acidobacteria bacterium]|nr:MAG: winged helix-turn-helix domain-containing protein [Acidobacteriota bacterium]
MPRTRLSLNEARRLALAAQGMDRPRPQGRVDARHIRAVIHRLGLLQLDFVNVLIPSHYLVLFSRLGPYTRSRLDDLVYVRREFTEQWAHEACILPMELWPCLRHRMETYRVRPRGFETFIRNNPDYVAGVLKEVRRQGPLAAARLPAPQGTVRRLEHAWFGTVPRAVLETHFGRGDLAVASRRPDFSREYDLATRIIPAPLRRRRIPREEARRQLLRLAARSHGIGTAADLADYYRMPVRVARPHLEELVAAGELLCVQVEGWRQPAYLHRDARLPRRVEGAALLSPFDPVLWHRPRTARLFQFDYRFEIFIPAAKRRWGTYVLPFLLGDRLVARVDLKAEREQGILQVRAAYLEPAASAGMVAPALAAELRTLADWLDLETVRIERRGNLARPLGAAFRPGRSPAKWFLYVLRCKNGSLYTGITTDVTRRLAEHRRGQGARFLRGKGPLRLVLQTVAGSHSRALRVEARVKRLPKAGKERLVSHPGLVRDLLKAVKSRREQCP